MRILGDPRVFARRLPFRNFISKPQRVKVMGKEKDEREGIQASSISSSSRRLSGSTRSNNSSSVAWRLNYPKRTCSALGSGSALDDESASVGFHALQRDAVSLVFLLSLSLSFSQERNGESIERSFPRLSKRLVNSAIGHDELRQHSR